VIAASTSYSQAPPARMAATNSASASASYSSRRRQHSRRLAHGLG
jgi:hypothetical protein